MKKNAVMKSQIRLQTQLVNRQTACEDGEYMECLVEDIENVTEMVDRYAKAVDALLFNVLDQDEYMEAMNELKRVHATYDQASDIGE